MIARRTVWAFVVIALLVVGSAVGEAAYYSNYSSQGWTTYKTGTYNYWGWLRPSVPSTSPSKPSTPDPTPIPTPDPTPTPTPVNGLSADENLSIAKVNAERTARGLPALKVNMELVRLARLKAKDMAENGYFDHISPTYGSPFEMLQAAGISYKFAGENIARVSSVTVAHNAFMDSPGHKANILSAGYSEIGVGVYKSGIKVYVSQLFIKPRL